MVSEIQSIEEIPANIDDEVLLAAGRVRSSIDTWADLVDDNPLQAEAALEDATEQYVELVETYVAVHADVLPLLENWDNTDTGEHITSDTIGAIIHNSFLKWVDVLGVSLETDSAIDITSPKTAVDEFWAVIDVFDADTPTTRPKQQSELVLTIFDGWVDATRESFKTNGISTHHQQPPGLTTAFSVTFYETLSTYTSNNGSVSP
ncbi:hypothetical protein [Salinibaculum rarum]|uniref:hypothetical protein n=1 Tax=Salinibaculum rarum TaxID=3058903 RepID=UPI00265D923A|nr:hypothetical protein [Salinibaculum sp. KK48]